MNPLYWGALGLERACLADIEQKCGPFDPDVQPHSGQLRVFDAAGELQKTRQLVEELRAQEPVERIVNTLLLSAIKEGARLLTIEPDALGVRVRHTVGDSERDHLHLPTTTLEPMIERLRSMAQVASEAREGSFQLSVEKRRFLLRIGLYHTVWGERVEIAFAAVPNAAA
ncbi:hypothetical protein IAD21_05319 [Abditibacteriota bacterium]|nr:hypothetical protein IAD21_05319 [Abditibacteriota bacterium]